MSAPVAPTIDPQLPATITLSEPKLANLQLQIEEAKAGLPYTRLRDAIFKYPTMAEALNGPVCERPSDETAGRES